MNTITTALIALLLQALFNQAWAAEPVTLDAAEKLTEQGLLELENKDYPTASSTLSDARDAYDNVLKTTPENVAALRNKGRTLALLSRSRAFPVGKCLELLDESVECFDKVLKISPRDYRAYAYKGNALLALSRFYTYKEEGKSKACARKAVKSLKESLRLDPANRSCIKDLKEAEELAGGSTSKSMDDVMHQLEKKLMEKDDESSSPTKKSEP